MSWVREEETFSVNDAYALRRHNNSILVEAPDFDEPEWIPMSEKVIHEDSEIWDLSEDGRGPGTLILHHWFAKDREWV